MAVCTGGQWAQAGTGWLIQWPEMGRGRGREDEGRMNRLYKTH